MNVILALFALSLVPWHLTGASSELHSTPDYQSLAQPFRWKYRNFMTLARLESQYLSICDQAMKLNRACQSSKRA